MNNHIGVSTLGITNDNYLFIWERNHKVQGENGKMISSGSGSCDWTDRLHGGDFKSVIEYAMSRELCEESLEKKTCNPRDIGKTSVIGFFRWLEKGGKPEFVGITKMNCSIDQIRANKNEVAMLKEFYLGTDDPNAMISLVDDILKESSGDMSLSLYMNLLFLKQYMLRIKSNSNIVYSF